MTKTLVQLSKWIWFMIRKFIHQNARKISSGKIEPQFRNKVNDNLLNERLKLRAQNYLCLHTKASRKISND